MIDVEQCVPSGPLGEFLDSHLGDGRGQPVGVTELGEGRSNLTFLVRRAGAEWVLRRPPQGVIPETAHDMMREYRVLYALAGTKVRAPRPLVACEDPEVLGVPFYLMERVPGAVIREELPGSYREADRIRIGEEAIDALVELHQADFAGIGLGDLGKPEGYLSRQIARWTKQWAVMQTRQIPDIEAVRAWLESSIPSSSSTAIVHGDYKLDNVVFSDAPPVEVRAILDWEMATLGDPLADLGYFTLFWPEPGEPPIAGLSAPSQLPGFSSRAQLLARYEAQTGFSTAQLNFYRTLALWKLAILCEGLYKRYLAGKASSDWYAVLEQGVPMMAARARTWSGA